MHRFLLLSGLVLLVFILGVFRVSTVEDPNVSSDSAWLGTELRENSSFEDALRKLSASARWEVIAPGQQQESFGENFSQDYRLVGIVDSEQYVYALLAVDVAADDNSEGIRKVVVGDRLPSDWVVTEIQNATVVAAKEEETQSVELFPSQ